MLKTAQIQIAALITLMLIAALQTPAPLQAAQVLFTPELIIIEEYSDNIYLSPENAQDDFMTSVGLNLTLRIEERSVGFELRYSPTYTWFAENSELDFWRHAASLNGWYDIGRATRLEFTDSYLATENPLEDYTGFAIEDPSIGPIVDLDLYRRGRSRYRTNTAQLRLNHQFGTQDTFYVAMRHDFREDIETTPGIASQDYVNLQPSLGLTYWFSQNWGTEIEGYYSNRDYDDWNDRQEFSGFIRLLYAMSPNTSTYVQYRHTRLDFDEEFDDDYHIYYPSAGIRYQFEEDAYLRIGAGYYIQEFDERSDTNEGLAIDSEINKRWAYRRGYIDASGASGYGIADLGTQDFGFTIYYQGRLGAGYDFTPRLSIDAYVFYRNNDYPDQEPGRTDTIIESGLGLSYEILQWMRAGLRYRFRDFSSDDRISEYTENRATLTITIVPTSPYRWN